MFANKTYYHVDEPVRSGRTGGLGLFFLVATLLLAMTIGYLVLINQSPELSALAKPDILVEERLAELSSQQTDFIKIEKLGLVLPFTASKDSWVPASGWHKLPERGNPKDGGNFIIGALRHKVGLTPNQTIANSPFYHLDKLIAGDVVEVSYAGQLYYYQVKSTGSVEPGIVAHEAELSGSRLTMFTATASGETDGFVVVEAEPVVLGGAANSSGGLLF